MAYRERQKISQMTPKGSDLEATDLVEVSVLQSGSYVTKSITGQEIINAAGGGGSGYVPYTGANQNVNLGEYELKAGQLTLDVSPTGTAAVGTTRWNNTLGSSETTLKGGSVILKNGVDLVARVVNKVTPNATLTKANYTAVRVSGAQGQRLAVAYAQANNDNNSADTIGLVTETIATNQEGFIITVGQIEDINTTGSLQGETWADGDVLYLSSTVAGAITNIKPTAATAHIVIIGYVEYAHAVHGKIYVKIMNGWELDELHNVYIDPATLANNDALVYESATQLWKNKVVTSSLTVGTTAITSGTDTRVFFQQGGVLQQDANFTFNNTQKRLTLRANGTLDIPFVIRNSADSANLVDVNGIGEANIKVGNSNFVYLNSTAGESSKFTGQNFIANTAVSGIGISRTNMVLINAANSEGSFAAGTTHINTNAGVATGVQIGTITTNSHALRLGGFTSQIGLNLNVNTGSMVIGSNMSWVGGGSSSGMFVIGNNVGAGVVNGHANAIVFGVNQTDFIIGGGKGNIGINYNPTGRTETNTIFVKSGTAPTTSIADVFQLYSADIVAGNAAPHFRTENGSIVKIYQETTSITSSTLVSNSGTTLTSTDTFDGYTIQQVVKALRNLGILA